MHPAVLERLTKLGSTLVEPTPIRAILIDSVVGVRQADDQILMVGCGVDVRSATAIPVMGLFEPDVVATPAITTGKLVVLTLGHRNRGCRTSDHQRT
jgi:hypothetical protein